MAVTSTMLPLGTKAPDFTLPDTLGSTVSVSNYDEIPALLVIFMCNHCPFVKHIQEEMAQLVRDYQPRGVAVIGINPNDFERYPDDSPEEMAEEVKRLSYTFPYVYDESQEVAKAFQAMCTPEFYLFNEKRKLVYRGQMDDSRPGNDIPVTGEDLRTALDALLAGQPISKDQKPGVGCSIKWRPGNEPDYA